MDTRALLSLDVDAWSRALETVGRACGFLGYCAFVGALALISRLRILDRLLSGLPRVYRLHHRLGVVSFLLLLAHPILIALSLFIVAPRAGAMVLFGLGDPVVVAGWLGLLALMIVMLTTFLWRMRYERWRWVHVGSGLSFAAATAHVAMALEDEPLRLKFLSGFAILGASAFVYWEAAARLFRRRFAYRIAEVRPLGAKSVEIVLSPLGGRLVFEPGQFAYVTFHPAGEPAHDALSPESHPFSIASAPEEERLRFVVKALGDYTTSLQALSVGGTARVEGPYGQLLAGTGRADANPQLWIAGGIGISPFLSLLRSSPRAELKIDLHYCVNARAEAIFLDEMRSLATGFGAVRVFAHYAAEEGFLDAAKLEALSGSLATWRRFVLCGPPGLMHSARRALRDRGIPNRRIHSEEFQYL